MDDRPGPSDTAKMWAALSYGSFFVGFPLGVVPLIQRDDAFALHHAKISTAVWLVMFVAGTILGAGTGFFSVVTLGASVYLGGQCFSDNPVCAGSVGSVGCLGRVRAGVVWGE